MQNIKALFFDVGGTVFDWKNTARVNIEKLAKRQNHPIDSEAFAMDWRTEMLNIRRDVSHGHQPWMNADAMHLQALNSLRERYPILASLENPMSLVKDTWHRLRTFDGAADGISRLRSRYTVVVLTILSWESIVGSSKAANVQWDGILSCEFLGYYKPSRQAYLKGVSLLGLQPDQAMMVAAHPFDLAGAQNAGMRTAYVQVPEEDVGFPESEQNREFHFDVQAADYDELCKKLGVM